MTSRTFVLAAFSLFFLTSSTISVGAEKKFLWGADSEGGAPFTFQDPRDPSHVIGFEVDIADAIAAKLGFKAEMVQNQWDGLIPGLKRGNYDVAMNGIEITDDRKAEVLFSDPYYVTYEQLTVRKETQNIHTLEDLKGHAVGTLKGSLAERILQGQKGVDVRGYDSQTTIYQDLANGRTEAVLLDHPVAVYYGEPDSKLKSVGQPIGQMAYGVAIPKNNPKLLAEVNAAIRQLKASGELRAIYDRWGIWNSMMADQWNDHSAPKSPPRALNDYLKAMGLERTWKDGLKQYWSYVPLLAKGAATTLELSLLGMIFAVVLGLAIALLRLYGGGFLAALGTAYVEVIRGTPLLIQLFLIFYGLPNVGIKLSPLFAAILGLGLNYAAYEAEVYRAGILSVPRSHKNLSKKA